MRFLLKWQNGPITTGQKYISIWGFTGSTSRLLIHLKTVMIIYESHKNLKHFGLNHVGLLAFVVLFCPHPKYTSIQINIIFIKTRRTKKQVENNMLHNGKLQTCTQRPLSFWEQWQPLHWRDSTPEKMVLGWPHHASLKAWAGPSQTKDLWCMLTPPLSTHPLCSSWEYSIN